MRIALLLVGGFASACAQAGIEATSDASVVLGGDASAGRMVTVTLRGPGSGTVSSAPSGITCPGDCEEPFSAAQTITLTAEPGATSMFTGWSGAGCTGTEPCTFTADSAVEIFANFERAVALTVGKTGNGTGTVTSSPGGITCGATCAYGFEEGTQVTLMATPSVGTNFTGWSGGGCSGTGPCVVTLTEPTAVNANFELAQYTLTVTKSGSGTVTSNPSGISCGADCSESYPHGTSVTLTTTSGTFTGWSGACSGTGPCTVTMAAATSVHATFSGPLTCTSVSNAAACTNGPIPEINLGTISASSCRTQCQTQMGQKGMSSGCWLVALNNICYCRSGTLSTGGSSGTRPGGTCE